MSDVIVGNIRDRLLKYNQNWLAVFCGDTGSGKSYSALKLAEKICPKRFGVGNVVFSAEEFMKVLNSGKLKRGDVVVWDEAGVGVPAKEWYSLSNRLIGYVMQTFRRDNLAVIFTTPNLGFIDSGIRKLFHAYVETIGINRKECFVNTKFKNIDCNPQMDKLYFKYPTVLRDGCVAKIRRVRFYLPSADLVRAYESKKKRFTESLKYDIGAEIKRAKVKKGSVAVVDLDSVVKDVVKDKGRYLKTYNQRVFVDVNRVCADFSLGIPRARRVKVLAEKILKL